MKLNKYGMLQASSVLFFLNMLASLLNYVCQLFMAKVLSVESFGTINTIFSFLLIVGVPGTTLTMIVAKKYAETDVEDTTTRRTYIGSLLKCIMFLSVIVFFVCLIFTIPLSKVLAITDIIVLVFTFILGALSFFQPIYSGVFSGNKSFIFVGIYSLLIPIYKIISIVVAKIWSDDDIIRLYVMLFVMILGNIAVAIVGHGKTKVLLGKVKIFQQHDSRFTLSNADINTFVLNICLMFYMNIDLLAVRFRGDAESSGLYSSVLLFGRIMYYFSTTLGTILLPMVTEIKEDFDKSVKLLNKTMGLMMVFSLVCLIVINVFGRFALELLFGEVYLAAQKYILYVGVISIALSLCTILVNYLVGIEKTKSATITMVMIDFIIVLLLTLVKDVECLLAAIGALGIVGMIILYCFCFKNNKHMRRLAMNSQD